MSETHGHDTHGHGHAEAEADRANVGAVGLLLALTAIVLAVGAYLLWIYFEREAERITYEQVLSRPSGELEALRATEAQWLGSWGVVNQEQGLYRMPIADGMQRFLQQASARRAAGQPQIVRPTAAAAPAAPEGGEAGTQQQQGQQAQ